MSGYTFSKPFLNGKTWWRVGYNPTTDLVTYEWWENWGWEAITDFDKRGSGMWKDYHDWPRYNFNGYNLGLPVRMLQTANAFADAFKRGQLALPEVAA